MQINFTHILQDSWNFFRNQQKIMFQFVLILLVAQNVGALLSSPLNNESHISELANINIENIAFSIVITQLLTSFISAWGLISIHSISQQNYQTLTKAFTLALRRFLGIIVLNLLMTAPMLLGLSEAFAALLTKSSPSIISLIAMLVGIWFFVRLNLTAVHYLSTQDDIKQTIQKIWIKGSSRKNVLFVYTLLVYFLAPILVFQLTTFSNNVLFDMVIGILSSILNIFMLVITYRFYSLFIKEE